jgi:hypothetical protein
MRPRAKISGSVVHPRAGQTQAHIPRRPAGFACDSAHGDRTPLFAGDHRQGDRASTHSTLAVGFALMMFMPSPPDDLAAYTVIHTGNRIDAVLGSQVFGHMLRLPLRY